ncbi:MAG: thioredoxin-disulfide reductase [Acidobacteria bacterium]|nr:thioredoxin-disulfide reductase [Acidobacteriota bacterium]
MEMYDVIIVGAGPAGLCAGMYTARFNLNSVAIEKGLPGGELLNTEGIEDYPGFEYIRGAELAERMENHAKKFGLQILNETVVGIKHHGDHFVVRTEQHSYRSLTVILTAGGTPIKLNVPGELEYAGRGVSYCAVCDGAFFRDQVITVVGGGDAAVEEAHFLTKYGSKIYVVHRRDKFRAQAILQQRLLAEPKVEVIWDHVVEGIKGNGEVDRLMLRNTRTGEPRELKTSGLFIFVGFTPNTGVLEDHVEHDANGYLITNERMETVIPGLFAAGDVRVQLTRQITTAVGDATTAAVAAEKYIAKLKDAMTVGK